MSVVNQAAEWLQRFDRKIWPEHRVVVTRQMTEALAKGKVVVADVGAAAGPEERWLTLLDYIHLLTFEPVERVGSGIPGVEGTHFAVALGGTRGEATLNLLKEADASTLKEVHPAVRDFPVGDWLEKVGEAKIPLDTLDRCLEGRGGLQPDYLKVDVEGADLEVLRGGERALRERVFAVRVEMSFMPRHVDAPLFAETDTFLRGQGFQLFQLSRESWVRKNRVHGYSSEPQLAWGDAVYFLKREEALARLKAADGSVRGAMLTRWVVILLSFGVQDYAVELVEAAAEAGLVTRDCANDLRNAAERSVDRSAMFLVKSFGGVLFSLLVLLLTSPLAGARRRGMYYVKRRTGRFCHALQQVCGRAGPHNSCIST